MTRARALAFYLPQFHPIPENDEWWGRGFTEWTMVGRARSLYRGHDQPVIPGALGFYDLRLPETREAQARLARAHGIEAFVYWRYWFAGRQLLQRPFDEVVRSGEPDLPFCIGWANQNWTSIWTGDRRRLLVEQTYPGRADDEAHFRSLLPAFFDERYVRVDGRPLVFVHRPADLPNGRAFTDLWRELAAREGLPGLYFVGEALDDWSAAANGFDAETRTPLRHLQQRSQLVLLKQRAVRKLRRGPMVHSYAYMAAQPYEQCRSPFPDLPMVMPNWDNTPRFGTRGFVLDGSTPARYQEALERAVDAVQPLEPDERIVFLKSWNEWAEGNYLEPDRQRGDAYLRATAAALGADEPSRSVDRELARG